MPPTLRRGANALSTAVAFFYASTVTTVTAQSQDNKCVSFSSSSTAGNPEDSSAATPTFFSCADGNFLTGVEASYFSQIASLSWTCSDQDDIGSFTTSDTADGSASFTVGLTRVQTWVRGDFLPFLGNMYVGGYDVDHSEEEGVSFSWKGPFGIFDADDEVLPGSSASYCARGTFATGVTVWASQAFVYGVMLECATVTETCSPQNYAMSLVKDTDGSSSTSNTDGSREASSSLGITLFASVGGGLLLIAIAVGVTCCICRRRPRKARGADETGKTPRSAVTGKSVAGGEGDASANNKTTKTSSYANEGVPPLPSSPPPPYVETPTYPQAPSPQYC